MFVDSPDRRTHSKLVTPIINVAKFGYFSLVVSEENMLLKVNDDGRLSPSEEKSSLGRLGQMSYKDTQPSEWCIANLYEYMVLRINFS